MRESIKEIEKAVNDKLNIEITIKIQIHDTDAMDIAMYHDFMAATYKKRRGLLNVFFNKKDIREEYEKIINNQHKQYNALLEAYKNELKR